MRALVLSSGKIVQITRENNQTDGQLEEEMWALVTLFGPICYLELAARYFLPLY